MTVHIHLGAHKTASTHIQAIFAKNAARLVASGVTIAPPKVARARIGTVRERAGGPLGGIARRLATKRLANLVDPAEGVADEAARLVAADENTLGLCAGIIQSGTLYSHAGIRAGLWRGLAARRPSTIYLSVRAYPAFFAAVHAQAVRGGAYAALTATQMDALANLPRRWPDVVQDIVEALPDSALVLWAYEDYGALRDRILTMMTGQEGLSPVARRPMRTPTAAAMSALSDASRNGAVSSELRAEIIAAHPHQQGAASYSPWDRDQRAHMRALYAEDLEIMRNRYGAAFLAP